MKSLPNRFPIRYAILVGDNLRKDDLEDDFDISKKNSLWCQFNEYIKTNPLTLKDLIISYVSAEYRDTNNNKLCVFPKLKGSEEWLEKTIDALDKTVPFGLYTRNHGRAFYLTLYSYKGMLELPIFHRVAYGSDKDKVMEELKLKELNYYSLEGLSHSIEINHKRIMNGQLDMWENYNYLKESLVFYLRIPYSKLWKALDMSENDGSVCFNGDHKKLSRFIEELEDVEEREYITVAIAKNLDALMTEEMISLYKTSNFCNNCGKPLPFDSKAKYCPNIPENIDCNRKRARIRKKR